MSLSILFISDTILLERTTIHGNIDPKLLLFDQQKLSSVFSQIEKFYQIEITVENSAIYNCVFTGDISSLDLFQAIKSVCLATNASYELNGPKILIKGNGCN